MDACSLGSGEVLWVEALHKGPMNTCPAVGPPSESLNRNESRASHRAAFMQMLTHLKEKGYMMAWGPLCLVCVSGNPVQPGRAAGVEAGRLAAERASAGGGRPAGGSCSPAWRQEGICQCRGQEESSRSHTGRWSQQGVHGSHKRTAALQVSLRDVGPGRPDLISRSDLPVAKQ